MYVAYVKIYSLARKKILCSSKLCQLTLIYLGTQTWYAGQGLEIAEFVHRSHSA